MSVTSDRVVVRPTGLRLPTPGAAASRLRANGNVVSTAVESPGWQNSVASFRVTRTQ